MSAPSLDSSLMGRALLQVKGCPIVYLIKFTHYAIGGVAVQYLHPQPPFWSRSGTLLRSLYAPGLAGFQQTVKSFFVLHFAVDLTFLGLVACLAA